MNFHPVTGDYLTDRYNTILWLEESGNEHLTPYNDGQGLVTIGVGFNLSASNVRNRVFAAMGIRNPQLIAKLADYLSGSYETKTPSSTFASDLNTIMSRYVSGGAFAFSSVEQVKGVYNGTTGYNGLAQDYEAKVDAWATYYGLPAIPQSKERLVLLSLAYNGKGPYGVLGAKLAQAIRTNNRAEAWYEIRYKSNGGGSESRGLAKRRYQESEIFGLYEHLTGAVDANEAFSVYRMYSTNRDDIFTYEAKWGENPDGTSGSKGDLINEANNDYPISIGPAVQTIKTELRRAATALEDRFLVSNGLVQAGSINPLNIQVTSADVVELIGEDTVKHTGNNDDLLIGTENQADNLRGLGGNDFLFGGSGNDVLDGGDGNDYLSGGADADTLIGGAGNDTLRGDDSLSGDILHGGSGFDIYYADDGDVITDSDGLGSVTLNGMVLGTAKREEGETVYHDELGNSYMLNGTTLMVNGLTIQGYSNGDLGINLVEEPPIKKKFKKAEITVSPIVLDLDDNGITTTNVGNGTYFDYDGNGFAERTGWVNGNDGILVRDLNGNGEIDNGGELFGNNTLLKNGAVAANGYAAMADLDTNMDGKLDAQDTAWSELKIWQDANGDGISQSSELKTLAELGIKSISTSYVSQIGTDSNGNQHSMQGSFSREDGSIGTTQDIWFVTDPAITLQEDKLSVSDAIRMLPQIAGTGNVGSLWQVMAQQEAVGSTRLKDLLTQFASSTNETDRRALTLQIVYSWTGVEDMDPLGRAQWRIYRNPIGDSRKLDAMEVLLGEKYLGTWCWGERDPNPHGPASAILLQAFDQFLSTIEAQLMQQTLLKPYYDAITYTWNAETKKFSGDMSGVAAKFTQELATNYEDGLDSLTEFARNLRATSDLAMLDTVGFEEVLSAYGNEVLNALAMAWQGLMPTLGNDIINGDPSSQIFNGLAGNDTIDAGGGNDTLNGGTGDDRLYGQDGNDVLDGGTGNDLLDGGAGNDVYLFGRKSGQDTIWSQDAGIGKRDVLKFAVDVAPSDLDLLRNVDDLILTIRNTGDQITVVGYFTNDGVSSTSLESIEFGDGTHWDFAAIKSMLPTVGSSESDRLRGYNTDEFVDGLAGDDTIEGQGGNDTLLGGSGNDSLFGGTGNDTLCGGVGNDYLDGGEGNDIYLFGLGDGNDIILDSDSVAGNHDVVKFTAGISPEDVAVSRDEFNLYLTLSDGVDKLTLKNWFASDLTRVEQISFDDGTSWDVSALLEKSNIATEGANYISGTSADDAIAALGGDDTVFGYGGDDTLDGGSGADSIFGGDGNDVIVGGDGSDRLLGDAGNDFLEGGNGIDRLEGGDGNDTLDGGIGNDYLEGGAGNDTYVFGNGSGVDVIYEADLTNGNVDTIAMASDVYPKDVLVRRDQSSLYLSLNGGTDKLVLSNWFGGDAYQVEQVVFNDGTTWDASTLWDMSNAGTDAAEYIGGKPGNDTLDGLGGNDTMYGNAGNDLLKGGAGNDYLSGDAGNDTLQGEAGNDTLYGGLGSNVLDGGAGNDTLWGSADNDIFVFGRGYGSDVVTYLWWENNSTTSGTVRMASGVSPSDLCVTRDDKNLYLNIENSDGSVDQLTLQSWFDVANPNKVTQVIFEDDPAVWDMQTLIDKVSLATEGDDFIYGTDSADNIDGLAGNDTILGNNGDDTLFGGEGNDKIYGSSGADALDGGDGNDLLSGDDGNDVLVGGMGDDTLQGGLGNDTYVFGLADGEDVITDSNAENSIQIDGYAEDIVGFKYDGLGGRIWMELSGGGSIAVGDGVSETLAVGSISVADGSSAELADVLAATGVYTDGGIADDLLSGLSHYANDMSGMEGNDTLKGGYAADSLSGGTGDDVLIGGEGNDRYVFWTGDGADTIKDDGATNVIELVDRFVDDVIDFTYDGAGGLIRMNLSGGDSIVLGNGIDANLSARTVEFADGTSMVLQDLLAQYGVNIQAAVPGATLAGLTTYSNSITGSDGSDRLIGGKAEDTLTGGLGADTLTGGAGDDEYNFTLGDGNDVVIDDGQGNTLNIDGTYTTTYWNWVYDSVNGWHYKQYDQIVEVSSDNVTEFIYDGKGGEIRMHLSSDDSIGVGVGADARLSVDSVNFSSGDWDYLSELLTERGATVSATADGGTLRGLYKYSNLMIGDSGDDVLIGGNVSDTLESGAGVDVLSAGLGDDSLNGGDGNDKLFGGGGDDTLDGGAGNDLLQGGDDDDIYVFGYGSGKDVIIDSSGQDTLKFAAGLTAGDLVFEKSGVDLRVSLAHSNDSIVLKAWFAGECSVTSLQFVSEWGWEEPPVDLVSIGMDLISKTVVGSDAADEMIGSIYNDTLQGALGDDTLIAGVGDDTYVFNTGDGVDQIYELGGKDTIAFGAGITPDMIKLGLSVITTSTSWEQVEFPDQDADLMVGDEQRQVLNVQVGDDGDVIQIMSGKDAIEYFAFADGSSYTWQELADMQGRVIVADSNDDSWQPYVWDPQTNTYGPGKVVSPPRLLNGVGTAAEFVGGVGDDAMLGGVHDDIYQFNIGDGNDVIADLGGVNKIEFGAGIQVADVSWVYDPESATPFMLYVGSDGDSIAVLNGELGAIQSFSFADGTTLSFQELIDAQGGIDLQQPSDEDRSITVPGWGDYYESSNLIVGENGNDTIYANYGSSNVIVAGKGNDTIYSDGWSSGAQTLLLNVGDGQDEFIIGHRSQPSLVQFGVGVDPSSVSVTVYDSDDGYGYVHNILITYGDQGDSLLIYGALQAVGGGEEEVDYGYGGGYGGTYYGSETPRVRVQFADGVEWSYDDLLAHADTDPGQIVNDQRIIADPLDPVLVGGGGNDTFVIGNTPGVYTIISGDNSSVELGCSLDSLKALADIPDQTIYQDESWAYQTPVVVDSNGYRLSYDGGALVVALNNGVTLRIEGFDPDVPMGTTPVSQFKFSDGVQLTLGQLLASGFDIQDTLDGRADLLQGTAVNDRIQALGGDDTLIGGVGNDVLVGGDGNDNYVFNSGDGFDIIVDHALSSNGVDESNELYLADIDSAAVIVVEDQSTGKLYLDMGNGDCIEIGTKTDLSVQSVVFDDGTTWGESMLIDAAIPGSVSSGAVDAALPLVTGAEITYSAMLSDGSPLPDWMHFDANTQSFSGTPDNWDIGIFDLKIVATDGYGNTSIRSFALDVRNINDAPVAVESLADVSIIDGTSFTYTVPENAFADDDTVYGDTLSYVATLADGSPLPAWLKFDAATRTFSGTPSRSDVANLNVSVKATDTGGLSVSETFTLRVGSSNVAPVAANDRVKIFDTDISAKIDVAVLLANDSDPNTGDALSISGFDAYTADGNAVSLDSDGHLVVDIRNDYHGLGVGQRLTDSFTYTVADPSGATSTATVRLTITGTDDAPVATGRVADQSARQDTAYNFELPADLFSDVDNNDAITLSASLADDSPLPAWLSFDPVTGVFSGTPSNDDVGSLSVIVTVTDNSGLSGSTGFSLSVANVNDAPTANQDFLDLSEDDGVVSIDASRLLANDIDPDIRYGDVLNIVAVSQASSGASVSIANGIVTYDQGNLFQYLDQGESATDSFSYTVIDEAGVASTAVVNIVVTGLNDAPVTTLDKANLAEDGAVSATGNVLTNDFDADQGTVMVVTNAGLIRGQYGSLLLNADGSYRYALDNASSAVQGLRAGQVVTEQFAYQASDGIATTPATIRITITGANDAPITGDDSKSIGEDTTTTVLDVIGLLSNDIDADIGDVLTLANFDVLTKLGNKVTRDASGNLVYDIGTKYQSLRQGEIATDSFSYTVTDSSGATSTATIKITITGSNDAPMVVADTASLQEDLVLTATGNVLSNDYDVDHDATLSVANFGTSQGKYGSLVLNADGSYSYTLDNSLAVVQGLSTGQSVVDVFSYQATDGTAVTNSILTVTINGHNDMNIIDGTCCNDNLAGTEDNDVINGYCGNDHLYGLAGDDTLNGGKGADTMTGGKGDDVYYVDNVGDVIVESFGEGIDTVYTKCDWVLGENIENLVLLDSACGGGDDDEDDDDDDSDSSILSGTGNTLDNLIVGNSRSNVLTGLAGNDTLDGGAGADTLIGSTGNDTYIVDNVGDVVTEAANAGTDTVQSSVTYTLGANVENLTLTGTAAINGTGNSLANVLIGNSANNVLSGGAGADKMQGGAGDDTYVVDNTGDVVIENANEGTDLIQSSVSYTLSDNVENLTLTGSAKINGTGNSLDNVLIGNSAANTLTGGDGNDTLDGGAGADTLVGGSGNDTYIVDNIGDTITEAANGGTDTVQSSLTTTLATNVENLTLTGTTAINGTGNTQDNVLIGNSAANTLTGGAGNDTLDGGAGADTLIGGTGNDTYLFGLGDGADLIQENDATAGNTDKALFGSGIADDQLWFRHIGNDLEVDIIGTKDKLTIQNWYGGSAYHVEQFQTADGKLLTDSNVESLVQAMAGFSVPPVGQTTLTAVQQAALAPVIAANWH